MDIRAIYKTLDIKNRTVIEKTCPKVHLDGYDWYDTTQYGFHDAKRYLTSRGLIVIHPVAFALVRFVEQAVSPKEETILDPKRILRRNT